MIFYSLPSRADFYPEIVNRIDVERSKGEASVMVLYNKYDQGKLERVVSTSKCKKMILEDSKDAFMFA